MEATGDRARRACPSCVDPVLIAAFEGWNDAGEAATRRGRAPRARSGTPSRSPSSTPRTTTTSRSTGRRRRSTDDGEPRDRLADHPALGGPRRRARPRRRPGPRHRAEHALADVLQRAPRRSPPSSASSWSSRSARCWPTPRTPGRSRSAAPSSDPALARALELEPSRYEGPTGIVGVLQDACARAGHPGAVALGGGPALRRAAAVPEGHPRAAAPLEDLLDIPSRSATCPRRPGPGSAASTSWPPRTTRSPSTSARSRRPSDTADLPEASGEAIAREFERYLRRRATTSPALGPRRLTPARRGHRPSRAAQSATPSRASTVSRTRAGRRRVGAAAQPAARRAQRSTAASAPRRVEVVGQRAPARRPAPRSRRRPGRRATARPASAPAASCGLRQVGVGPLPVVAVVVRQQRQPDRHRVDAVAAQPRDEAPGCPGTCYIFSPSSPTMPACT